MPKPELEFFAASSAPIKPTGTPGESEQCAAQPHPTSKSDTQGVIARILHYAPRYTQDDQPRIHDFWEEVYFLEGRLYDRTLERWIVPGDYCCRPPGMIHGPYTADPEKGCKQLALLTYDKPTGK